MDKQQTLFSFSFWASCGCFCETYCIQLRSPFWLGTHLMLVRKKNKIQDLVKETHKIWMKQISRDL